MEKVLSTIPLTSIMFENQGNQARRTSTVCLCCTCLSVCLSVCLHVIWVCLGVGVFVHVCDASNCFYGLQASDHRYFVLNTLFNLPGADLHDLYVFVYIIGMVN